ncbi:hypothetical protein LPJ56_002216 [Coemansia sp. RSA 2599]|nr:hypothetical protein LPJ56_002216 [Coemansia sp. RSA 2599]
MGVKRLTALLERFAPACITTPTAKDLRGWCVGIDSNIFIHKFFRGMDARTVDPERRHLHGIHRMALFMKSANITPVFVFDNAEPTEWKLNEISRRQLAKAVVSLEHQSEIERAARIAVYRRILKLCIGIGEIDSGAAEYMSMPSAPDASASSTRADELVSALCASNATPSSLRAAATEWLLIASEQLNEMVLSRAKKPTIESRLSTLEHAFCLLLLDLLSDAKAPDVQDPAHVTQSLASLIRFNDERLEKLSRRSAPLTEEHIEECQALVLALGFAACTAGSGMESEAVCASLDAAGIVDATCSEDLDVLPFGGRRLLRNFGSPNGQMVLIDSARALSELQLTREAFIDLCILCGTDFSSTLKSVGPITALKLIQQHGSIESILATGEYEPREFFDYEIARRIFASKTQLPFSSRDELRPGQEQPEVLDRLLPDRKSDYAPGASQFLSGDPFAQNIVY